MTMFDLVPLLGAVAGGAVGYGLWLARRRQKERSLAALGMTSLSSSRAQRSGAEGSFIYEVEVQDPLLHQVDGGYVIGDNSATRAELEAFMARGGGRGS